MKCPNCDHAEHLPKMCEHIGSRQGLITICICWDWSKSKRRRRRAGRRP